MKSRQVSRILCTLLVMLSCLSCKPDGNILVLWSVESDDPGVAGWNRHLKSSLRSHGVRAHLDFAYNPYKGGDEFLYDLSAVLDSLGKHGRSVDMIVAEGDANLALLYASEDPRIKGMPAVSLGAFFPSSEDYEDHINVAIIKDTVEVQENLALMRILWPETRSYVTDLDWTMSYRDSMLREDLDLRMEMLDRDRFINNVKLDYRDAELKQMLGDDERKVALSVLSLWDPWVNISRQSNGRVYPQFAFNPQTSENRVILYKNDFVSKQLTKDQSFMLFCTASSQLFEVSDSCAGGYLAPMDICLDKVADNIRAYIETGEPVYGIQYVPKNFYLDWNVLRGHYNLDDIPSYVNIRNQSLRDREPQTWSTLLNLLVIAIAVMTSILIFLLTSYGRRRRNVEVELRRNAENNIQLMQELNFMKSESDLKLWRVEGRYVVEDDKGLRVEISDAGLSGYSPFFREKLKAFLNTGSPGRYSLQVYGKSVISEAEGWFELRMLVTVSSRGVERSGVMVGIDSLKKSEADVLETQRLLLIAQERDSFISSMSHEMRTPLNSIVGFTQIMTDTDFETTPEERQEMRKAVLNNGDELTVIINNMLALTKIENGTMHMDMQKVTVRSVVDNAISDMTDMAALNGISLEVASGPEECKFSVDPMILRSVMQNLVGNAIKFSESGTTVTIGWRVQYDKMVVLYVKDEGRGISRDDMELVFHRFFKVDAYSPGVGLGLSLAQEYVTAMGGRISVESELGKGSTFSLTFLKNKKDNR